jgi:integrase
MPLKLIPPRKGKSPNWSIRGTYLGIYVDRSTKTDRRKLAADHLATLQRRIESGEFPEKPPAPGAPTFVTAALAYIKARDLPRFARKNIGLLIRHFGATLAGDIDQGQIDGAALALYPTGTPVMRNAYVYTPVSAILHHANIEIAVRRPKGGLGRVVNDYMVPDDAMAVIEAAEGVDREFALLLKFLLYTGCRVGEALALRPEDLNLVEARAWVRTSKNDKPRTLRLRADLVTELSLHRPHSTEKFFRFRQGGHFAHMLNRAKLAALGIPCPRRRPVGWYPPANRLAFVNFHTFCHTWATWMRQYGGADLQGLVATGRWSSERVARRYSHVVARDEWERVESLPAFERKKA